MDLILLFCYISDIWDNEIKFHIMRNLYVGSFLKWYSVIKFKENIESKVIITSADGGKVETGCHDEGKRWQWKWSILGTIVILVFHMITINLFSLLIIVWLIQTRRKYL